MWWARRTSWDFRTSLLFSLALHVGLLLGLPAAETGEPLPPVGTAFRPARVQLVRLAPKPVETRPTADREKAEPERPRRASRVPPRRLASAPSPPQPSARRRTETTPRPSGPRSPQTRAPATPPSPSEAPRAETPRSPVAPLPTPPSLPPVTPAVVAAPVPLPSRPGSSSATIAAATAPTPTTPAVSAPAPAPPAPATFVPHEVAVATVPFPTPPLPQPQVEIPQAVSALPTLPPPAILPSEKRSGPMARVATGVSPEELEPTVLASSGGEKPSPSPATRLADAEPGAAVTPPGTPIGPSSLPAAPDLASGPAPLAPAGPPGGTGRVLISGGFPVPPSAGPPGGAGGGKALPPGGSRQGGKGSGGEGPAPSGTGEGEGRGNGAREGEDKGPLVAAGSAEEEGYTGLIIDARGLGIKRTMSPAILTPDGRVIFGRSGNTTARDEVIGRGIVSYLPSLAAAKRSERAGKSPLVITAIGRGESAFKGDIIISAADARRIWEEDKKSRFLSRNRVVVVVDR